MAQEHSRTVLIFYCIWAGSKGIEIPGVSSLARQQATLQKLSKHGKNYQRLLDMKRLW